MTHRKPHYYAPAHAPTFRRRLDASAFIHPFLLIALGGGVLLVTFLLFCSWSSVGSTLALDGGSSSSRTATPQGSQATAVPPTPSTQSALTLTTSSSPASPVSPATTVVREEPKQPEEVFEVVEPEPTPVPVYVPAIYAQPEARSSLTEEQLQLLDQTTADFTARIQSSGLSPYAPGYADLWKQSAQQADDIFRQQYGDEALQSLKGPPPAPTPEPTPLSPADDAFRARYGEDALEMRVLQREGRLIRVRQ